MIIKIDDDIIKEIKKLNSNEKDGLSKIAEAYRNNKHYIIGSIKLFELLSKYSFISENDRATFRHLCSKTLELSSLNSLKSVVLVSYNNKNTQENECFNIKLEEITKKNFLEESRLICESLEDCSFYYWLSKFWLKTINNKFMKANIRMENVHGGGNDLGKVIEEKIQKGYACCIIADSDKKNKEDNYGNTYNNAIYKINKNKNEFIGKIKCLEVREKENLLFPEIMKCTQSYRHCKDLLEDFDNIYNSKNEEIYYYLDLKDGVKIEKYNSCQKTKCAIDKILDESNKILNQQTIKKCNNGNKIFRGIAQITETVINEIFKEGLKECLKQKKEEQKSRPQIPDKEINLIEKNIIKLNTIKIYMKNKHIDEWNKITNQILEFGIAPSKKLY